MKKLIVIAAVVAVSLFAGSEMFGQVVREGAMPPPLPLFPASNWWNTDVSRAPVDPGSTNFINHIGAAIGLHPDFGGDDSPDPLIFGMVYVVVPGTQPLEQVDFYESGDESDAGAPGRAPGYPIPVAAKTETKWIEGGLAANDPMATGDRHMMIVDRDNRIVFELYGTQYNTTTNHWEAASGAIFPLDSNVRRQEGWTSADAAGLAITPGLVRYEEVFSGQPIRHAFRLTLRDSNGYVFPGSHVAGTSAGALPMGARLRLKATKNISGFTPEVQRIFQAMKTYGLIMADNGTDMYIGGTYDLRWDNGVLNPAFSALTASDFEVVSLGWQPLRPRDFNGDLNSDLFWRNTVTGENAQWLMSGTTAAAMPALPTVSDSNFKVVAIADFQGDGKADVLWRNSVTGANIIWLMDGPSIIDSALLPTVADPNWVVAGTGDFQGDGRADILWHNVASGASSMWLMNGTSIAVSAALPTVSDTNFKIVAVADFQGDGKDDVLWRNSATGANVLWLMNATSIAASAVLPSVADPNWTVAGAGDFQGDGKADILWRNTATGDNAVWLMNGTTVAVTASLPSVPDTNWKVVRVGDFQGDGLADILWRHSVSGSNAQWLMNGTSVAVGSALPPLSTAWQLAGKP